MIYELIVLDEYMERVIERGTEAVIVKYWHNNKREILRPALQSDRPEESAIAETWSKKEVKTMADIPHWNWPWYGLKIQESNEE